MEARLCLRAIVRKISSAQRDIFAYLKFSQNTLAKEIYLGSMLLNFWAGHQGIFLTYHCRCCRVCSEIILLWESYLKVERASSLIKLPCLFSKQHSLWLTVLRILELMVLTCCRHFLELRWLVLKWNFFEV